MTGKKENNKKNYEAQGARLRYQRANRGRAGRKGVDGIFKPVRSASRMLHASDPTTVLPLAILEVSER